MTNDEVRMKNACVLHSSFGFRHLSINALAFFQSRDHFHQGFFAVEEHQAVVGGEEGVWDPRKAGAQAPLHDDDVAGFVDVENRHAGDRGVR